MTATQLLADLRREGFVLAYNAGKINVRPKELITDEIRGRVAAVRDELLQVLEAELVQLVPAADFVAELQADGQLPPTQPAGSEKFIPSTAIDPDEVIAPEQLQAVGWVNADWVAEALELALAIPAGWQIHPHHHVVNPIAWRQMLAYDALQGPQGARARSGALQSDLAAILARGSPVGAA